MNNNYISRLVIDLDASGNQIPARPKPQVQDDFIAIQRSCLGLCLDLRANEAMMMARSKCPDVTDNRWKALLRSIENSKSYTLPEASQAPLREIAMAQAI